jgi:N-acetylmuramoyl-L-alanine amidase
MVLICIDPGHGGKESGANYDGNSEKDLNLSISLKLATKLKDSKIKAILTRYGDDTLSLNDRCAIANTLNADLFISIHCNAFTNGSAYGWEAYYHFSGKALATEITRWVASRDLLYNRGVKRAIFKVLTDTAMPATLLECGFMSNSFDLQKLRDNQFQDVLAGEIKNGIKSYLVKTNQLTL